MALIFRVILEKPAKLKFHNKKSYRIELQLSLLQSVIQTFENQANCLHYATNAAEYIFDE